MRRDFRGLKVRVRGIKIVRAKGRVYYYHRATGQRLPAPHEPGFLDAYTAAEAGRKPSTKAPPAGTVAALCAHAMASDDWRALKPSTQAQRRRIIGKIAADRGEAPARALLPRHIQADLKGLSPAAANNRLKCWRFVCKVGLESGLLVTDPASMTRKRKTTETPHQPWTDVEIAAYRAHWPVGAPQRLAFELYYWTGARCVDARRLGRQMVDGKGWLRFRQEKTGDEVQIPLFCALPDWLAPFAADHAHLLACLASHDNMTFVVSAHGRPRSQKGISQWMAANARAAGLDGFTAHGLRAARAIALAELGATTHQIGAWTGQRSLSEIERYTRAASRRRILAGG